MSESTSNSVNPGNDPNQPAGGQLPPGKNPPPSSPAAAPKRKRIWLKVMGALLLLLILLIALAPTIAGLGFVRSIVVGKINDNLNGSVEIGGYSVGWTGGISANDVKVFDAQKNLILQLNKFSTQLSLLDAAKGNLALGDTVVDVDLVKAQIGDDGQLNYAKLAKQEVKQKSSMEPKESSGKSAPITVPAVSGKITVTYKGTVYQGDNALVQIQPSTAVIDIPNINQAIHNDVVLKYAVNGGATGTVHIAGDVSAVKSNQLDLGNLVGKEQLDLADVDLKAASALLPLASKTLKLQTEGIASGSLTLNAVGADSLSVEGRLNVAKFAASGQPLKGNDRVAIDQISMPIDITRSVKDGQPFIDVKHADVLLNDGKLGKITVIASAPQESLIAAAALVPAVAQKVLLGTEPAAESLIINGEGNATIAANLDVAALAAQIPETIGLQKGTALTQGHLTHQTTIAISKDTATIDSDTKLPDLQGTSDGKAVQLSPIDMAAGVSAVGGTAPDLHNLSIHLTSGFLNVTGGGATLSKEKVSGNFDLANLQAQASQFVDLDKLLNPPTQVAATPTTPPAAAVHVQLTGGGNFDLSTDGDLIKPDGQGKVTTSLTITGVGASGIGTLPPVKLTNLTATLNGDLHRGTQSLDYKNFIAALTASGITVSGKDSASAAILDNETITANVSGDATFPTEAGTQSINLTALQIKSSSDLFGLSANGATPGALSISNTNGSVKASGVLAVGADLKKLFDLEQRFGGTSTSVASNSPTAGQLQSGRLDGTLTLTRADQPRTDAVFDGAITNLTVTTQKNPISNETVKLTMHAVAPDDRTAIKVDASLDSRFAAAKLANAILEMGGTAARPQKVGMWDTLQHADINLNVPDLPALYAIINAFSAPEVTSPASAFREEPNREGARIITVALRQADAQTPEETPEEAARRRKREKAAKAAKAAKATQAAPAETPAAPLQPLQITSGSMAGTISIARDAASQTTTLNVSDLSINKLGIARGDSKYAFANPVDFKLAVAVKAADDGSKPSVVSQIQQIQITQLAGDLAVAKLSMPQPIAISNPGDTSQIDAHGTIQVDGTLAEATPLLAVLQGDPKPMPYGGTYNVSQVIHSAPAAQGKLLNLVGGIDLANFQIFDDSGKVVYTEPTVAVKDDLDYIIAKVPAAVLAPTTTISAHGPRSMDQAIVRSFSVNLPGSQALSLNFAGRVVDPLNKRVIRGIGQDPAAKLDVTYDLAKLWPIVKPMLAPDMQAKYKDLKVVGKEQRSFALSGYFPVAKTTAESMHHLNADGGLALEELDLPQGLTITKFDQSFKMTNGVLQTLPGAAQQAQGGNPLAADSAQPPTPNQTAVCNQGIVDLSGMTLDMGQPSPVLGIEKNHVLLKSIHINPVLADTLGAGNVLFKDATQANGLLDVTIVECDKVPLGDLIARRNDAAATITYSVSDLSIDGPAPQVLSSVLPLGGQGLHGGIQGGKLVLANGEVNNDFALNIIRYVKPSANGQGGNTGAGADASGGTGAGTGDGAVSSATATDSAGNQLVPVNMPLKFSGGVSLATGVLKSFLVNIPQGLLPSKWASIFPNGLAVPFTGNNGHPTLDIQKAVIANAGSGLLGGNGGGGAGNLLNGLLGGKHKKKPAAPATPDSSGQ